MGPPLSLTADEQSRQSRSSRILEYRQKEFKRKMPPEEFIVVFFESCFIFLAYRSRRGGEKS